MGFLIRTATVDDADALGWVNVQSMIYVLASEYGSGAAQALLDATLGDSPASLWVADPNPRAQAFYRRNGFLPDGERTVAAKWENLAEIRMVR